MQSANEKSFPAGKIKWRQHELIFITATAIMITAGYLWNIYRIPVHNLAGAFINNHVEFSLFKNEIFPTVGMIVVVYLSYLWIHLYSIPRLLFPKKVEMGISKISVSFSKISLQGLAKKILKEYAWLFIQIILLVFIIGTALNIATYYKHQWQFNYPGFSIFYREDNSYSQLDIGGGYFFVAGIILLYALYILLREMIINLITGSKQREYNIMLCNKVTAFLLQFACVPIFLQSFNLIPARQLMVDYFLVVPAIFAMFITNVYCLFPLKGDSAFFSKKIIIPLLSTSFVYAAPLIVFVHESIPLAFLYSWAVQLFIVTPFTWWYYQTNKEKILQLRVVEKELAKSKTDLQFLRSQINPHFLFNTLNTLYGTALQENADRTAGGIQKLGDMMRFMLHENNLDFIEMNKEITYLRNYIDLQKLRTQSSPDIVIEDNIDEQNCHHKIAPMLLIPLVENAFKHGISLKEKSWIKINLSCTEKNIVFEVHNSMHKKSATDPEKERSGIGYKNVLERLKLIYANKFQISVNGDGEEFFVKLLIETV